MIMNDFSFYGQQCDDYVRQEFFPAKSILVDGSCGVASVAFDGEDEFLWTGGHSGLVSSFYGLTLEPYSSFQAHDASEVRFLLPMDQRLVSLTSDTVACSTKLGQPLYYHRSRSMSDLQCALLSPANHLYVGGLRSCIIELDLERRTEVRIAETGNAGNVILRFSNSYLCSGSTGGIVSLLDPNSLKLVRSLDAHSGSLSDFDVCSNQLITCGFSLKNGQQVIDRHLMMFDLRYCKAMAPMQMLIDPMYLRFVQTYSNQICVVSQNGKFQVLEQGCSGYQSPVYEVPVFVGSHLTSCVVSSSNMVLAFGESAGYVHTFTGNHDNPVFNHYLLDTEFATAEPPDQLTVGFSRPLSTASYYSEPGPSVWASPVNQATYRNPRNAGTPLYHSMMHPGLPNAFYPENSMKSAESLESFNLPESHSKIKSNSLGLASRQSDQVADGDDQLFVIPKCYRKVEIKYSKYGVDGFDFRSYNKTDFAGLETHIPNAYCNAMIQVLYFLEPLRNTLMSHLCEREFCLSCELGFLFHMLQQQTTKTCQATNFLRAFRTIPQVTALGLLLSDSDEVLGKVDLARLIQNWNRFILQQIDSELARQASNKLYLNFEKELQALSDLSFRSNSPDFNNSSDAVQIQDVVDEKLEIDPSDTDNDHCVPTDSIRLQPPEKRNLSIIKQLFAYNVSIELSCKVCGQSLERNTSLLIVDLLYPESSESSSKAAKVPFSKVVERSLNDERRTRSWCSACSKYQMHYQHKKLNSLPDVLSLHCHLESPTDFAFWRSQEQTGAKSNGDIGVSHPTVTKLCRYGLACTRVDCRFRHEKPRNCSLPSENSVSSSARGTWVPFALKLFLAPDGKVRAAEAEDISEPDAVCYELVASVACIKGGRVGGGNHLVSHIMVEKGSCKEPSGEQWCLFNDFAISPIDKNLAVTFDMDWKLPCLLYFAKMDINKKYNIPIADPIMPDVLFASSLLITPRISDMKFVPLNKFELPQDGDIIGIDAEFVKLKPEKAELHSDGTKSTIKPSQMSVARVTCIREKEPLRGLPFIDDYIATQEEVADYLTEFSGIQPGDLDPVLSCKYLTTLKATYLKLRCLINAKVIFVGHGLKKDFRVLNLVVPPEQIVDTVELFHLPKRRMISLKFLAWYFLGLKIQSSNHDSIEDSCAAIQLYDKYMELQACGMDYVKEELERLYETGQLRNWRIPEDDEDQLYLGNTSADLCLA